MTEPDPRLPHAVWMIRRPTNAGAEIGLLYHHLWWGWGLLCHERDLDELTGEATAVIEAWRPDAAPHVGNPAADCPVCAATLAEQAALIDAGLPPAGGPPLAREARPSPLHPS